MIEIEVDNWPKVIKKGDFFNITVDVTNEHMKEITVKEVRLFYPVGFVTTEEVRKKQAQQIGMLLFLFQPLIDFFGYGKIAEALSKNDKVQDNQAKSITTKASELEGVLVTSHPLEVIIQPKGDYREDFGFKAGWAGGLRPRPDTYGISGEVVYEFENKTYYKSRNIVVSLFPSMGTMLVGTLVGSVLGTFVRVLTGAPIPSLPGFISEIQKAGEPPNVGSSIVTLLFVNLILGLLIGIILMRKKDVQPFLTVEDFWGGILLGFLVGLFGLQFLFQFGNIPSTVPSNITSTGIVP